MLYTAINDSLAKLALETARDSKLVIRLAYLSRKLARMVEKKVG